MNLHNILFSENGEEEFKCMFGDKKHYSDPTIYINITSKITPSDAPEGCEKYVKGPLGKLGFLDNKAMNKEAHEDLERVGIAVPSSTRAISALSGGQRQAVAIGRAVSWASKVIILDEPTNHLGARQAGEVLEVMKAAKAKGLGVVFISHTLPHVLQVTDRIVVLRLGKIVANAPTSEFNADTLLGTITGLNTLK